MKKRDFILDPYDTPETIARHENYMKVWAEYREKTKHMKHGDPVGPHELYVETLKLSGPPGDYRKWMIKKV